MLLHAGGSVPVMSGFEYRYKVVSLVMLLHSGGRVPVRLFENRYKIVS